MQRNPQTDLVNWLLELSTLGRGRRKFSACEAFILAQKIAIRVSGKPIWHSEWAQLRANG